MRSEHTDDEVSNLSFCRQTARNGYVIEFSFSEASRLESLLFSGYDPHFEGDEPPGL
jgi:hypothetical protein